jgi:hypothetical protein
VARAGAEFTIELTCKPYWRGTETLTSTASSTPFVTLEVAGVTGDVPALGRLIVTDTATQSRRHVEWGLEGPLTYNSRRRCSSTPTTRDDGVRGSQSTHGGRVRPERGGQQRRSVALQFGQTMAVCGTGNLSHVGVFRVKAGSRSATNAAKSPAVVAGGRRPVELERVGVRGPRTRGRKSTSGRSRSRRVLSGTQRWTGQVEADSPGEPGHRDTSTTSCSSRRATGTARRAPLLLPRGRASSAMTSSQHDRRGRAQRAVAPIGGTWATSGRRDRLRVRGRPQRRAGQAVHQLGRERAVRDPRLHQLHGHPGRSSRLPGGRQRLREHRAGRHRPLGRQQQLRPRVRPPRLSERPVASRYYDDFTVSTPAAEPIALYSGRNMQIRYDDTIRQDSTGTYTAARSPTAAAGSSSRSAPAACSSRRAATTSNRASTTTSPTHADPGRLDAPRPRGAPLMPTPARPVRRGHDRDGTRYKWDANQAPAPGRRTSASARRSGRASATRSLQLARRIDQDYPDLNLVNTSRSPARTGRRVRGPHRAMPRDLGDRHSIGVTLAGWMAHAKDRKFQESTSTGRRARGARCPSTSEKAAARSPAVDFGDFSWANRQRRARLRAPEPGARRAAIAEDVVHQAPPGVHGREGRLPRQDTASRPGGRRRSGSTPRPAAATSSRTSTPTLDDTLRYADRSRRRHAPVRWRDVYSNGPPPPRRRRERPVLASSPSTATTASRYTGDTSEPDGVYASDVIRDIARATARCSTPAACRTPYVIQHLAFPTARSRTTRSSSSTSTTCGTSASGRTSGSTSSRTTSPTTTGRSAPTTPGTTFSPQGPSTENLFNGIAVTYTDPLTGVVSTRSRRTTTRTLADTSTDEPVEPARHHHWDEITLSTPDARAQALQLGGRARGPQPAEDAGHDHGPRLHPGPRRERAAVLEGPGRRHDRDHELPERHAPADRRDRLRRRDKTVSSRSTSRSRCSTRTLTGSRHGRVGAPVTGHGGLGLRGGQE